MLVVTRFWIFLVGRSLKFFFMVDCMIREGETLSQIDVCLVFYQEFVVMSLFSELCVWLIDLSLT